MRFYARSVYCAAAAFLLVSLIAVFGSVSAVAAEPSVRPALKIIPATTPAPQDEAVALEKQVEAYLRNIHTLKARFIQTSNNGQQVAGDFMLKRPGRMRFDYDAPVTDFIVADGTFIYYYDGQLKQQSNTLISKSLADFFLRADLNFSGDLSVADIKRDGGLLQVTLTQAKDPLAGSLTLGLSENPMVLKKWRVVDGQGLVTEVELFDISEGMSLNNDLFRYYDPTHNKQRLNK